MKITRNRITYLDDNDIKIMMSTEEGKVRLDKLDYLPIKWHVRNSSAEPNRRQRRLHHSPMFGMMKNNREHPTKHKLY